MTQNKMRSTNDISLNVLEAGPIEGPILVFLHGFPEFSFGWRKQIDFFANQGYRVFAPDQRGYNLSDKPKGIRSYALPELVNDIAGLIQSITSPTHQKITLVAHDWGGAVAWSLVSAHPELISKFIVINMPHPKTMQTHLTFKQMMKSWYMGFFQIPALPEAYLSRNHFAALSGSLKRTSNRGAFSKEDFEQYRIAWAQPGALTSMIHWYRAIRYAGKPKNPAKKIATPTLILWGKKDEFLGAELAEASLERCENAKLVFFDDATHWLHLEKPEAVNEAILNFIKT